MSDLFFRVDLERLVKLPANKLHEAGVEGTIKILGGAAIALVYHADRTSTADIDALIPADERIADIIYKIGMEESLPENWINNRVKFTSPFEGNPNLTYWKEYLREGSIIIQIASAEFLLAMKLKADRGVRDRPDIEILIPICGLTTIEEIIELYENYYPQDVLKSETREVVINMLRNMAIPS